MIGGDSNGVPFHTFCFEEWKSKYGTKPPWLKVDYIELAKARTTFESEDIARAAWQKFLASDDPFYAGHEPRKFLSSLGRWVPKQRLRRDKMRDDGPWAERTAALVELHRQVNADDSIPEAGKRDEVSRRFRERFPN